MAEYAEDCIGDVSSCLSSNNYDASNPEGAKSRTAINACYSQIKTCLSVNGNIFGAVSPTALQHWVTGTYSNVETYTSDNEIELTCSQITDATECGQKWGYCLKDDGSRDTFTHLCEWTVDSNNVGSCSTKSDVTCNAD